MAQNIKHSGSKRQAVWSALPENPIINRLMEFLP
jgi:hypothetical protein